MKYLNYLEYDNNDSSLPEPSKTPILFMHETDLDTTSDGGRGVLCNNTMPSQKLHVVPPDKEAALILGDDVAPPNNDSSLLEPSKTPTLYVHEVGLAATSDGGRGVLCNNGTPSQGIQVGPPYTTST